MGSGVFFEISASAANIRSGPGTDYEVVTQAREGDFFEGTGNVETSGERIWYQIYLDDSHTDTGWVSDKVVLLPEW